MNQRDSQPATDDGDFTIHDLLSLPEEKRRVLNWMQRQTICSLPALTQFLEKPEDQAQKLLRELEQQGLVQAIAVGQETLYQVHLHSMRHKRHQRYGGSVFDAIIDED